MTFGDNAWLDTHQVTAITRRRELYPAEKWATWKVFNWKPISQGVVEFSQVLNFSERILAPESSCPILGTRMIINEKLSRHHNNLVIKFTNNKKNKMVVLPVLQWYHSIAAQQIAACLPAIVSASVCRCHSSLGLPFCIVLKILICKFSHFAAFSNEKLCRGCIFMVLHHLCCSLGDCVPELIWIYNPASVQGFQVLIYIYLHLQETNFSKDFQQRWRWKQPRSFEVTISVQGSFSHLLRSFTYRLKCSDQWTNYS